MDRQVANGQTKNQPVGEAFCSSATIQIYAHLYWGASFCSFDWKILILVFFQYPTQTSCIKDEGGIKVQPLVTATVLGRDGVFLRKPSIHGQFRDNSLHLVIFWGLATGSGPSTRERRPPSKKVKKPLSSDLVIFLLIFFLSLSVVYGHVWSFYLYQKVKQEKIRGASWHGCIPLKLPLLHFPWPHTNQEYVPRNKLSPSELLAQATAMAKYVNCNIQSHIICEWSSTVVWKNMPKKTPPLRSFVAVRLLTSHSAHLSPARGPWSRVFPERPGRWRGWPPWWRCKTGGEKLRPCMT